MDFFLFNEYVARFDRLAVIMGGGRWEHVQKHQADHNFKLHPYQIDLFGSIVDITFDYDADL